MEGILLAIRSESRTRRCLRSSYQEGSLGVFGALDALRVKLALLQAALHQADGAADAPLDVLKRCGREALPQLVVQHLSGSREGGQR